METQYFILGGELKAMADRWVVEVFEPIVAERSRIVHDVLGCDQFVKSSKFRGGHVVLGVVSDKPIEGMRRKAGGFFVPDLRTKIGKSYNALLNSVCMPPTAEPVLEQLELREKDCLAGHAIFWPQVFKPHDQWILSVPQPLVTIELLGHPDLTIAVESFRPMAEVV
jgi:hypothetical protein